MIYIPTKIKCEICNKIFTKSIRSDKLQIGDYGKICQKCWDKTIERLQRL